MPWRFPQIYPTSRLAVAFAAGSLWFFAMPWLGSVGLWAGLIYNLLLLAAVVIDYTLIGDSRKCSVRRVCESTLSIAEQNSVRIEVTNRGQQPVKAVVRDEPPVEFESTSLTVTMFVEPDETEHQTYRVKPSERGDYWFGDLHARYTTFLGLVMRQESIPAGIHVKVYPDIFQTKKHLLLVKENRTGQMGLRRSRLHGQGQEFERLRDYVPDDSLRHIDWKASARRGNLITREYDVEQSQNIMLLLDLGRTMASRTVEEDGKIGISKADCAINASVLLAHVAAQSDDRVGLYCFADGPIAYIPPGKGAPQAARLMEALYPLQPRVEESNYYENLMLLGRRQRKRSLVFLFTDLIDPESSKRLISSIGVLVRKHLVVCIALADYELPAIIEARPGKAADMYTQAVALGVVKDRKRALAHLSSQGVIVLDATPSDLSVATVNKYLQLKREARL